jgi:hypothetical protein
MAFRDTRERQSSAAPHAVNRDRVERVCGTRWRETAGAAGKRREQKLVGAHNDKRGANARRRSS